MQYNVHYIVLTIWEQLYTYIVIVMCLKLLTGPERDRRRPLRRRLLLCPRSHALDRERQTR